MRKSKVRETVVALVILAIALFFIAGTYARYSSSGTANSSIQIAKWAVKLNGTDMSSSSVTVTPEVTFATNANVSDDRIAPARSASFQIELDPTGSEVAIDYVLSIDTTAITGIANSASEISVSGATYKIGSGSEQNATITGSGVTIPQGLSSVEAGEKVLVTVTVTWDNANDAHNAADTENGVTGATIVVPTTITAQQHI